MILLFLEILGKAAAFIALFLCIAGSAKAQTAAGDVFTTITYLPTTFGWMAPAWVKISDSSAMMNPYARKNIMLDSMINIRTAISLKMNSSGFTKSAMIALGMMAYTDTATAFAPYARTNVMTATYQPIGAYLTATTGDARYPQLSGSYSNPAWITALAAAKVIGLATVATTGSYTDLSNKPTIPTVSGASGTYGIATVSNGLVTAGKRQESYSGTTNASGNYTVTYSVAYGAAPNVQFQINGGLVTQNALLTASSATGFTVNVKNRTDIVGLLPSYANVTGAAVDVVVVEK